MSFYYRNDDWSEDESDVEFDNMHKHEEHLHSEIIHQCTFGSRHLINARLASKASLQYQADSNIHETAHYCLNSKDIDNDHGTEETIKSFPTMLTLIGGTLVGSVKYSDIYIDSDEDKDNSSTNSHVTNNDKDQDKNNNRQKIPALLKIARKVAKLAKTQLDEKQYIAYEMIACTFLLGLVNDGCDKNTKLGAYLQQTMEITSTADDNDTIKKLKDQLLMFLTMPAGLGKSTAMKVAQQFCYEFYIAVGIMRSDKTFIFTAYTGSAASLFGGVTISKDAFLNQQKQLSVDNRNEWQDVQIVVIDKVSFIVILFLKHLTGN
jgi:hypothetical protein